MMSGLRGRVVANREAAIILILTTYSGTLTLMLKGANIDIKALSQQDVVPNRIGKSRKQEEHWRIVQQI